MDWSIIAKAGPFFMMIAGLGLVIFVHELGHFLVAKLCGVKCEKFYVGFDVPIKIGPIRLPASIYKFQWGETEYGIGIIPLGGYVKMLGQDDNPGRAEEENERIRVKKVVGTSDADGDANSCEEQYELDPRSYPAKSVPRRMAIISAGVIMNLITGVLFATIAYRMGVSFTPCEIGDVVPGGAAWQAGIEPGDRIIQLGRGGEPNEKLRFDKDLREQVMIAGPNRDLPVLVRRLNGEEKWLDLRPMQIQFGRHTVSSIGVAPIQTLELDEFPTIHYDPANPSSSSLRPGDKVISVDGKKVESHVELQNYLADHCDKPVTLTITRTEKKGTGNDPPPTQILDVPVEPSKVLGAGFVLKPLPIVGIRPGSPADRAGIKKGEELVSVHGQPVGDAMTLDARLRDVYGTEIDVEIRDASGAIRTVKMTPVAPRSYVAGIVYAGVQSLGVSFPISSDVIEVTPDSPAAKAGVAVGDRLIDVKALKGKKELDVSDAPVKWPEVFSTIQHLKPDVKLKFVFSRGSDLKEVMLDPVPLAEYAFVRDVRFKLHQEVHRVESFGEALSLGKREVVEGSSKVLLFLHRLVTGEISANNVGGVLTIGVAATSEASRGLPRLLIFMTLLSANLAVMNFLPIPVLDGGHLMFLAAEAFRGKPVDEKWQIRLTMLGLAFVLCLMVFAFSNDVRTLAGW